MQTRSPILGSLEVDYSWPVWKLHTVSGIIFSCSARHSRALQHPSALQGQRTRIMTDRPIRMRNENSSYPTADRTPTHAPTQRLWGQIFQRCTQQQCQHSRLYIPCVIIAPKCEQDSLPYLVLLKWSTWHSQQKHPQQQGRVSFMEYGCLMFL